VTLEEAKVLASSGRMTIEEAREMMQVCRGMLAAVIFNLLHHGEHRFVPRDGEKAPVLKASAGTIKNIQATLMRGRIGTIDEDEPDETDEETPAETFNLPASKRRAS
jgi:hypothetical protein